VRDLSQGVPHAVLKSGAEGFERQVERGARAREVLLELLPRAREHLGSRPFPGFHPTRLVRRRGPAARRREENAGERGVGGGEDELTDGGNEAGEGQGHVLDNIPIFRLVTVLIEAAVESLDAALAAAEGGAHRLELCTDLAHGGTTPDVQLLRACRSQLVIPIFVLVRPRAGDFVYTPAEHRTMLEQIHRAKDAGARGIVTGALSATQHIAETLTAELLDAALPLPVTFHRGGSRSSPAAGSLPTTSHGSCTTRGCTRCISV
ncbi:MAG: hypothetical protein DMD59_12765, partial [Gemmatimonadetes bacterium]